MAISGGWIEMIDRCYSIKRDAWIRDRAIHAGMIQPFVGMQIGAGKISYGLSSFGYDIRIADEFRIFTPATGNLTVVDPKNIDESCMVPYLSLIHI